MRCFGGAGHGHGHDDHHHHEAKYDHIASRGTQFKIPTQEDLDY